VGVHPVPQVVLDAQRDLAGDQPPAHREDEIDHRSAEDREAKRQQVLVSVADPVDREAHEPRDQRGRAARQRGEPERDRHAPPVGAQEDEQSPEKLQTGNRLYFVK
jgi:hypothetical protein